MVSPIARAALLVVAWFAFLITAIALAARFVPVDNHAVLFVAALSPYLMAGAAVCGLLLLLGTRSRWVIAVAVLLTAVTVFAIGPRFVASGRPDPGSVAVRVLTANLQEGSADPEAVIAAARDSADLLMVQEITPEFADALTALESEFPYRAVNAHPGAAGVGIWSRHPIISSRRDGAYQLGMLTATVRVPGAASDTVVLAAHVVGPWPWPIRGWRREMARLPETLKAAAASAGPGAVIVAGDFNATPEMRPFRRLLSDGFHDARDQAGAGLSPTFPADRSVPPLLAIDHILTYQSTASSLHTVRIPGSDHTGLVATIHIPG